MAPDLTPRESELYFPRRKGPARGSKPGHLLLCPLGVVSRGVLENGGVASGSALFLAPDFLSAGRIWPENGEKKPEKSPNAGLTRRIVVLTCVARHDEPVTGLA